MLQTCQTVETIVTIWDPCLGCVSALPLNDSVCFYGSSASVHCFCFLLRGAAVKLSSSCPVCVCVRVRVCACVCVCVALSYVI